MLLVSLDACRADRLSLYGSLRETSPFLEEVAARGIVFPNSFINTLGTTTSHTTILTSLYQETHRVAYRTPGLEVSDRPIPKEAIMLQEILSSAGYVTLAVTDGGAIGRRYGFDEGFHVFDDGGGGVVSGTKKMVALIKRYMATQRPIFAFYHTYEIHSPYLPPEEYLQRFGQFESTFVPSNDNLLRLANSAHELSPEDMDFLKASYDAGIRFTDDRLKEMYRQLADLGFFDNYLLIITADHGEEFGEHGGLLHRGLLYEELLHVPLIIAGTGLPTNRVDERMASSVDIAPTILSYVGLEVGAMMEGSNLLASPVAASESSDAVFSQKGGLRFSVRTREWKLIETTEPNTVELYDLRSDPGERNNLADTHPERVASMRKRLTEWVRSRDVLQEVGEKVIMTEELKEQLRELGYIVKEEEPPN